jgi:serine/threonine protein kinase
MDLIHRDIKPANFLLDTTFHVKVCDFGFAEIASDKSGMAKGSPLYCAPEVWDKKCDKKIGCEKSDEPHKQLPIKNKISGTPKQELHFPECPSCGRYLNLLGGNPMETYLVCKFCNKSYVLNVFTEKLTLQEDN